MTTRYTNVRSRINTALLLVGLGGWAGLGVGSVAHAEETGETVEPRPRSTPRVDRSVMEYRSTLRVYDVDIDSRFRPVGSREPETILPDVDYRTTPSQPSEPSLTDLPPPRMPARRTPDPESNDTEESGWGWLAAEVAKAREVAQDETKRDEAEDDDRRHEATMLQLERNIFEDDQRVFRPNDGFFISTDMETTPTASPHGSWSVEEGAERVTDENEIGGDPSSPVMHLPESLRNDPIARLFRLDVERDSGPLTFADNPSPIDENRFRAPDSPTMAARTLTGERQESSRFTSSASALWSGGQRGEDTDLSRGYQPGMYEAQDAMDEGFRVGSSPFDSVLSVGASTDRSGAIGVNPSRNVSGLAPIGAGGVHGVGLTPVNQESRTGFGQVDSSRRSFDDSIRQPSALPW